MSMGSGEPEFENINKDGGLISLCWWCREEGEGGEVFKGLE